MGILSEEQIGKLKEGIAAELFYQDWDEENGFAYNNATNGYWEEQTEELFREHYYRRADSLFLLLDEYGVKIDTGEPENPYHSDQCSDNLNPQANCFNEGVKAAHAKLVSMGQFLGDGKQ